MKNVCIVGYGAIGPTHAQALEKVENAGLYAICDIDAARRKLCAEKYSVAEYVDFDTMLLDPKIDTVHICTPHYLHFDMTKKALAAGKDVVVEKPVTMTKAQFAELTRLEGAGRVCVVFQNRLNPSIVRLKELIDSQQLGAVKAAKGFVTWFRDADYYAGGAWRGKWQTEGGGVLINQSIHTLDYFPYLIGNVESVRADMVNFSLDHAIEVEDTFTARLNFANGVKGIFFATNAYAENSAPLFEVLFEKGTARYMDNQLWVNGRMVTSDQSPTGGKSYWGNGHEGLIKRYYDDHQFFTVADAENTMNTVFAMYESAKNGGVPVTV